MIIVGFAGAAGAGKTTAAEHLGDLYGAPRLSLADPLRSMALVLNPVIHESGSTLKAVVATYGWTETKKRYPAVRDYLQTLGTEAVRDHLGPDVWVNALAARLDALPRETAVVTVDDVRFDNEAEFIKSRGGKLVLITGRRYSGVRAHRSEKIDFPTDARVNNNSTRSMFYSRLEDTLEDL